MHSEEIRERGRLALNTVLTSSKNIRILENAIALQAKDEYQYDDIIMQVAQDIRDDHHSLKSILESIKNGQVDWKHSCHSQRLAKLNEHDDYLKNPFEIAEGALTCPKCKCANVHSYSQQTRSGDESTTVFAWCMRCKYKWVS